MNGMYQESHEVDPLPELNLEPIHGRHGKILVTFRVQVPSLLIVLPLREENGLPQSAVGPSFSVELTFVQLP
jgi:hypothetical protein